MKSVGGTCTSERAGHSKTHARARRNNSRAFAKAIRISPSNPVRARRELSRSRHRPQQLCWHRHRTCSLFRYQKEAEPMRFVKTVCCAVALAACLTPSARADEWNKKTILTFSGPVQIPGVTLSAGTYVFKLADLASNRHVVQVFDKDGKKIYATILAIPDQKLEPSDKPVVMFSERPAGVPQAVKAWFYPGETIGNEFVYPKDQAVK